MTLLPSISEERKPNECVWTEGCMRLIVDYGFVSKSGFGHALKCRKKTTENTRVQKSWRHCVHSQKYQMLFWERWIQYPQVGLVRTQSASREHVNRAVVKSCWILRQHSDTSCIGPWDLLKGHDSRWIDFSVWSGSESFLHLLMQTKHAYTAMWSFQTYAQFQKT